VQQSEIGLRRAWRNEFMRRLASVGFERCFPRGGRQPRFGVVQCLSEGNYSEALKVDMERHGAIGRFRMCAGLMLRRHASKRGFCGDRRQESQGRRASEAGTE